MSYVKMKDPEDVIDFVIDWSASWLADSEEISTSTWSVSPAGALTVDSDSNTTTTATVFLSAGAAGTVYRVTNEIVTNQSRTAQRSVIVRVEER